jgi:hypothetical protein
MNHLYFTEYHEQSLCHKMWKADNQQHQQTQVDSGAAVLLGMFVGEQGCFSAHFKISTFCVRTLKHIHYQSLRCLRLIGIGGQSLKLS